VPVKGERYALFKNLPTGPLWVEFEDDLEKAKQRMAELSKSEGVAYFVYDLVTRATVATAGETAPEEPG
jgi:hypothetical protein